MSKALLVAGLLLTGALSNVTAQTSVLSSNSPSAFTFSGGGYATASIQNITGPTFTQAWHINITSQPVNLRDVSLTAYTSTSVAAGEALIATFYYRRTDTISDEANLSAFFEKNATPYDKSLTWPVRGRGSQSQWRQVSIPFISFASYAAGAAKFDFQLGSQIQQIDIGGVQVTKYGQKSVFGSGSIDATSLFSFTGSGDATETSVAASGPPFFTTADEIKVTTVPTADYLVRLSANIPTAVTAGDNMVAIFWVRSANSNGAFAIVGATAEQVSNPYTKSLIDDASIVDGNWKLEILPFTAAGSYAANAMHFYVKCGVTLQTVDFAGLQLLDFGSSVSAASLTSTVNDYPGRLLSDSWRTDANTRIAQLRTANFTVNVENSAGAALSGVNVSAAMQKHRFGFGSAVSSTWLTVNTGSDATKYATATASLFNKAVLENDLKWNDWYSDPGLARAGLAWLRQHAIFDIRGHNLVWPDWSHTPTQLNLQSLAPAALNSAILSHIDNETMDTGVFSFLTDWDVVNEPYANDQILNAINSIPSGQDGTVSQDAAVIKPWLAETATDDSYPLRFINDYGSETNATHLDLTHENYEYNLTSALLNNGAALDGFGFQSHFESQCTPPVTAKAIFDRFGGLGLDLQVTEFDQDTPDQALQADYLSDYLTLVFSHPDFDAFLMWEFWDTAHWKQNAPVYDASWNLKPSGEAWKGLIFGKWWTNASASSNSSGVATINGYQGRYTLTASSGGITKVYHTDLTPGGSTLNLKLGGSTGTSNVWLYEAENAVIYSPFGVASDPAASGGKYIVAPAGLTNYNTPTTGQMRIDTEATGTVNVWVRVIAPGDPDDSFWIQADGGTFQRFVVTHGSTWHWSLWTQLTLAAGTTHTINIANREGGTELDQVLLTDDLSFSP